VHFACATEWHKPPHVRTRSTRSRAVYGAGFNQVPQPTDVAKRVENSAANHCGY
jgi:hypothetical protein